MASARKDGVVVPFRCGKYYNRTIEELLENGCLRPKDRKVVFASLSAEKVLDYANHLSVSQVFVEKESWIARLRKLFNPRYNVRIRSYWELYWYLTDKKYNLHVSSESLGLVWTDK